MSVFPFAAAGAAAAGVAACCLMKGKQHEPLTVVQYTATSDLSLSTSTMSQPEQAVQTADRFTKYALAADARGEGVDVMCAADVADNDVFRGSINTEKWELCFRRREDLGNGGSVIEQQSFRQESGSITLWAKQGWDLIDAKRHEYSMFSRQETVAVLLRRPEAGANFAASDYVFVVNANVSVPPGTVRVFMGGDTVGSLGDILGRTEPNCLRVQLKHSRQVITVPATCVREAGLDNELDVLDAFCSGEITRYTEKLTGRSQRTAVTTARFPVVLCIHLDAEPSASTYRRCLGLFHRVGVQLAPAHDADAKVARDYIFCNRKAFDVVSTSNTMCARSLPIPEVPSDHMPISATVRHRCSLLGIS